MNTKRVFCYYEPVGQIRSTDEAELIKVWEQAWRLQGWKPRVLTSKDAAMHPSFHHYSHAVRQLPSINPGDYDYHCWMRWLAMAVQPGEDEIVMSDYDMIPYGFQLKVSPTLDTLVFYHKHVPALVSGHPLAFLKQCQRFANYRPKLCDTVNDRPHVSDMVACMWLIDDRREDFVVREDALLYTETGWETATAVHYSNSTMQPNGKMPRYLHIPQLRS